MWCKKAPNFDWCPSHRQVPPKDEKEENRSEYPPPHTVSHVRQMFEDTLRSHIRARAESEYTETNFRDKAEILNSQKAGNA